MKSGGLLLLVVSLLASVAHRTHGAGPRTGTERAASDETAVVHSHTRPALLLELTFDAPSNGVGGTPAGGKRGTDPVQSTGIVAHGPVVRDVPSATARLGRAVRLSGGHLALTPERTATCDAFTIELWVRLDRRPPGIAALYAADQWASGAVHFNVKPNGAVELAINGTDRYPNTGPDVLETGRWVHLAGTYDRRTGRLCIYRNGRAVLQTQLTRTVAVRFPSATIGAWRTGTQPRRVLLGSIDDVRIHTTALPAGAIRRHYLEARGVPLEPIDYASRIRPLLERSCYRCHGPAEQQAGLRLDVRDSVFRGGESGEPAVVPYDSESSELVRRITARDPADRMPPEGPPLSSAQITLVRHWIDQGAVWPDELAGKWPRSRPSSNHWAFQPLAEPKPPLADASFVRGGNAIDAFIFRGLTRAGLAPSPPADRRTLIRRLFLDVHGLPPSPEQIGRFLDDARPDAWIRLVDEVLASPRYGERWASHWLDVIRYGDTHGFEVNTPRPNAWPYRDYVILSLNEDKPFNRFVQEQIAGDQLGVDAATGFLVAAPALLPGQIGKDEASQRQARSDALDEILVTVSEGLMGITLHCARCHNHKFDPFTQKDYYRFVALFAGVQYGERPIRPGGASYAPATRIFGGTFHAPEPTFRLYRGDPMQRRERVAPDIPSLFGSLGLESTTPDPQRRLALAEWLVSSNNPLTARVIVNRIWQHHFGQGIVRTPSDFGKLGARPTHPELLDYLAGELIRNGWSLKHVHRLILTSNTYRQSSRPRPQALAVDREARWLWRFPPRRLDMEPIRDSMLAVSGVLDSRMGGPGFSVFKPNDNYVRVYEPLETWGPDQWRRMIYVHRVRMERDGVFGEFDCPDAGQPAPQRARSTTALQALNLLNSSFVHQQAELFAARIRNEAGADADRQLDRAFLLAFGRVPTDTERTAARRVLNTFGLPAVCRALFNANEFLFLP